METLSAATARLQAEGYVKNFVAADGGQLTCADCGATFAPRDVREDQMLRFEGSSDPGDESILLALSCPSGHKGLYSSAYGPYASALEADVLASLHTRPIEPPA